jgi:hypothetical protein
MKVGGEAASLAAMGSGWCIEFISVVIVSILEA